MQVLLLCHQTIALSVPRVISMHFRGQTVKTHVAHVWNTIVQTLNLVTVVESKADHKKWSLISCGH